MVQPSVIRLLEAFEAFATRAEEDALIYRKLDYVIRQNEHLIRLSRKILEAVVTDPAQVAALQALADEADAAAEQWKAATAAAVPLQPSQP